MSPPSIHFYEAMLASLAILVWHFYMVIFDPVVYPMDLSWLTGTVPADHLRETRPAYYRALLSERAEAEAAAQPKAEPAKPDAAVEDKDAEELSRAANGSRHALGSRSRLRK